MDVTHPNTDRRAGLSRAKIAQAARTLAHEHGLENWSIRDLTQHLEVVPSAVYHYSTSRGTIANATIGQLIDAAPLSNENLGWRA